jgi:hypothetical protein
MEETQEGPTRVAVRPRVVGVLSRRNYPDHVAEFTSADVGQHVCRVEVDIKLPFRAGALAEIAVGVTDGSQSRKQNYLGNWRTIAIVLIDLGESLVRGAAYRRWLPLAVQHVDADVCPNAS